MFNPYQWFDRSMGYPGLAAQSLTKLLVQYQPIPANPRACCPIPSAGMILVDPGIGIQDCPGLGLGLGAGRRRRLRRSDIQLCHCMCYLNPASSTVESKKLQMTRETGAMHLGRSALVSWSSVTRPSKPRTNRNNRTVAAQTDEASRRL